MIQYVQHIYRRRIPLRANVVWNFTDRLFNMSQSCLPHRKLTVCQNACLLVTFSMLRAHIYAGDVWCPTDGVQPWTTGKKMAAVKLRLLHEIAGCNLNSINHSISCLSPIFFTLVTNTIKTFYIVWMSCYCYCWHCLFYLANHQEAV